MTSRRVVITGVGAISPLGNDADVLWENILKGNSGIDTITKVNKDEFTVHVVAEVKDFDAKEYMDKKEARRMDYFTQYAVAASKMAVEDAKLEIYEDQLRKFINKGYRRVSPFFVPMLIPDMAAGQVSIQLGAKGINSCTVTACASGTNSIGDAFKAVQRGDVDYIITGGTEAPIT